jgi:ribosome-associated translation inhibitor RaiA
MQLRVSAPGKDLSQDDIDRISRDLEKIDRRLDRFPEVYAEVRINGNESTTVYNVTLEIEYSRNHLIAKTEHQDIGQAVREAREEILRQINDRGRGSHSQYAKGR